MSTLKPKSEGEAVWHYDSSYEEYMPRRTPIKPSYEGVVLFDAIRITRVSSKGDLVIEYLQDGKPIFKQSTGASVVPGDSITISGFRAAMEDDTIRY